MICIIAAVAQNGAIGYRNKLLYSLPNDLRRFKTLTTGHTIIMGRRTYDSLPKGALPNRRNIVLSRRLKDLPNVEIYSSLKKALEACSPEEEIYIIGGSSVYAEAFPLADRLYLTEVIDTPKEADVFFPLYNNDEWEVISQEFHEPDERHAQTYRFVEYSRK